MVFAGVIEHCPECGNVVYDTKENAISLFDNSMCYACEMDMFKNMEEQYVISREANLTA